MKTTKLVIVTILVLILAACEKDELPLAPAENQIENKDTKAIGFLNPQPNLNFTLESKGHNMGGFADHETVEFNDYLWLVGGNNSHTPRWTSNSQVWRSPNGKDWKLITQDLFEERRNHSLIVFDNTMWLIGGINQSGVILSDIWNTVDGIHWNRVKAKNPLIDIGQNNSVVFNNRIFVFRGNGRVNHEVWSTTNGLQWQLETDNAFSVRSHYKTVVVNDRLLLVIGGWLRGGERTNEIWASKDGRNWFQKRPSTSIFEPRLDHTVTFYKNAVWVIGGSSWNNSGTLLNYGDIWFSKDLKRWHRYNKKTPFTKGLQSSTSLVYKNKLWVFGGYHPDSSNASIPTDRIWSID